MDVWRQLNPKVIQYIWVMATDGRVSAAWLDRIYLNKKHQNQLIRVCNFTSWVFRPSFTVVSVVPSLLVRHQQCPYWQFNVQLVRDEAFCQAFSDFWGQ